MLFQNRQSKFLSMMETAKNMETEYKKSKNLQLIQQAINIYLEIIENEKESTQHKKTAIKSSFKISYNFGKLGQHEQALEVITALLKSENTQKLLTLNQRYKLKNGEAICLCWLKQFKEAIQAQQKAIEFKKNEVDQLTNKIFFPMSSFTAERILLREQTQFADIYLQWAINGHIDGKYLTYERNIEKKINDAIENLRKLKKEKGASNKHKEHLKKLKDYLRSQKNRKTKFITILFCTIIGKNHDHSNTMLVEDAREYFEKFSINMQDYIISIARCCRGKKGLLEILEKLGKLKDLPDKLLCPLSCDLERIPVFDRNGDHYDLLFLWQSWKHSGNYLSPHSKTSSPPQFIIPNREMHKKYERFLQKVNEQQQKKQMVDKHTQTCNK